MAIGRGTYGGGCNPSRSKESWVKQFIIVSGLPASGKSWLAQQVSRSIGFRLFDKDDFLEELFKKKGIGDSEHRWSLSREADLLFQSAALASDSAVLASWWKHPLSLEQSGTPMDWLIPLGSRSIEIYCKCDATVAVRRFMNRDRHPGHLDDLRSYDVLLESFKAQDFGPLDIGRVLQVSTEVEVEIRPLIARVNEGLAELCNGQCDI